MCDDQGAAPSCELLCEDRAGARGATVLNIGLAGDPGPLDPAQSGNFIDRNVFAALCDKLVDTDAEMNLVLLLVLQSAAHDIANL